MAAPSICSSAPKDEFGQFQLCTSVQTIQTPDLTLTLTPTLRKARGRRELGRGSPAIYSVHR